VAAEASPSEQFDAREDGMNDPDECHRKAEALATLALMFPEYADRYRAKERYWRDQQAQAERALAKQASGLRRETIASGGPAGPVHGRIWR
jgi:hypothetical protein